MDENRVEGTVRNLGGKLQEGIGHATGNAKNEVEGKLNQAAGAAQDLYGQAADSVRDNAGNLERWIRNSVENQPYTSVLVVRF